MRSPTWKRGVARASSRSLRRCGLVRGAIEDGATGLLNASRISPIRRRGMRAVYDDGVIENLFHQPHREEHRRGGPLNALQLDDPVLGESIASFVEAARLGAASLVRPEEARRALETALLIEKAAAPLRESQLEPVALYA